MRMTKEYFNRELEKFISELIYFQEELWFSSADGDLDDECGDIRESIEHTKKDLNDFLDAIEYIKFK